MVRAIRRQHCKGQQLLCCDYNASDIVSLLTGSVNHGRKQSVMGSGAVFKLHVTMISTQMGTHRITYKQGMARSGSTRESHESWSLFTVDTRVSHANWALQIVSGSNTCSMWLKVHYSHDSMVLAYLMQIRRSSCLPDTLRSGFFTLIRCINPRR